MKKILQYHTSVGMFYIAQSSDGRYHPIYNEQSLGSYANIYQAIDDLSIGSTFSFLHESSNEVVDVLILDIPDNPLDWQRI